MIGTIMATLANLERDFPPLPKRGVFIVGHTEMRQIRETFAPLQPTVERWGTAGFLYSFGGLRVKEVDMGSYGPIELPDTINPQEAAIDNIHSN